MRLELTPAPLELLADDQGSSSAPARRRLAGLAVPYDVEAAVGFQLVTFAPGSVSVDGPSPLLLGHDPNRPVGVLADHAETPAGLRATFGVDATSDGDAALVQAQSGSRAGLSVGVDLVRFEMDADNPDRIRVLEARLAETSLVALAAYPGANVDQIAARKPPNGGPMTPSTTPPKPEPDEPTAPAPEPDDDDDQLVDRIVAKLADRRPALVIADRAQPKLRLGEYVQTLVRAEQGDQGARQRLEAATALDRQTVATNPGVIPIAYVSQVVDSLGSIRPLFDAMSHAEMPPAGMMIRRPAVTTRPDGNWLADDTAGAPTGPVVIGDQDAPVVQWAWAGAASVALVERSSPSYVEEVFTLAVKSYYRDVETLIAGQFPPSAGGPATIGAAVAEFAGAYREYPTLLVMGAEAYGLLLDATGVFMFASGSADAQGNGNYAGLKVVVSPDLVPTDAFVTRPDMLEVRETSPIRLSVSDVESLSLEIGVTSFYSQARTRQDMDGVHGAVGLPTFTPAGQGQLGSGGAGQLGSGEHARSGEREHSSSRRK